MVMVYEHMEALVRRALSLWVSFFQNSLTRDMEFKANFLGGLFVDLVYYSVYFFLFNVIYSYVDTLGVFSRQDIMIFLVVCYLADTCDMFFFSGNIFSLNQLMVKGELDFFLLKPVDSQFITSLRKVRAYALANFIILLALLIRQIYYYPNNIALINISLFILSFIMGILLWYSIDFIIASTCFWFKNFSVSGWLSHEILKFSSRPDSIYTGFMRKILFSLMPMTLIASVPTRFLLYGPDWDLFLWQLFITIIFLFSSRVVWHRGLLRYESASS